MLLGPGFDGAITPGQGVRATSTVSQRQQKLPQSLLFLLRHARDTDWKSIDEFETLRNMRSYYLIAVQLHT